MIHGVETPRYWYSALDGEPIAREFIPVEISIATKSIIQIRVSQIRICLRNIPIPNPPDWQRDVSPD